MKKPFKDLFSTQASDYARYRPTYPKALFQFLARTARERALVWDCGTGNGQAAIELAQDFSRVIATDPSEKQIRSAPAHPRVEYRVEPAERTSLVAGSVDLVTVAQAFHWFRHAEFYTEVRRVARPGAHLAIWSYANARVTPEVDAAVGAFYSGVLGSYWEPERRWVEEGYRSIEVPFPAISAPTFEMAAEWTCEQMVGYLGTWSALATYIQRQGQDPLPPAAEAIRRAWGNSATHTVTWPLVVRLFQL
ncbi:MAG: class I SAM-dependent methyltransferase [Bacteriovoracia bacterium]